MKKLKGTKTFENLTNALIGESLGAIKYLFFASKAKKDGYVEIANFFEETSKNEKEHAKVWFKLLNGGSIPLTTKNLESSFKGELLEGKKTYKEMSNVAKKEGFNEIAKLFEMTARIEYNHGIRFQQLLKNIKSKKVFSSPSSVKWICLNCGNIEVGRNAPIKCPVCNHKRDYYKKFVKSY